MRTTRYPRLARALLGLSVAVASVLATTSTAAAATTVDHMRYAGKTLNSARVPAQAVEIEVWSKSPAREVQYFLGDRKVASDTSLDARDGYSVAAATVDLTGLKGSTMLKAKIYVPGSMRSVWKYFTVVPNVITAPSQAAAATTGVPDGVALRPSGSVVVTKDGQVVDGLDIKGCLTIQADAVTVRNTRITCPSSPTNRAVRMAGSHSGLVIQDSEVDGMGTTELGIEVSNAVLRRVEVRGVTDGVRIGNSVTIEDSWVHDLVRQGDGHPDAVQGISAQNVVIRRNTLNPRNYSSGDFGNAAIMLGSETGTKVSRNVVIEGNVLDGGNYSLNISGSITAQAFTIRSNKFGTDSRYGPIITPATVSLSTGNAMVGSGTTVAVARPK